jgi:hypothetical protein
LKAWGITVSEYHSVFLKFGNAVLNLEDGDIDGEWELHVRNVVWRLESPEEMLIGSADKFESVERVCDLLENQTVKTIEVMPPVFELRLTFENQLSLLVFPIRSRKYTGWWLFMPSYTVLTSGPGSKWSIGESS